jgi:hypothetical protein
MARPWFVDYTTRAWVPKEYQWDPNKTEYNNLCRQESLETFPGALLRPAGVLPGKPWTAEGKDSFRHGLPLWNDIQDIFLWGSVRQRGKVFEPDLSLPAQVDYCVLAGKEQLALQQSGATPKLTIKPV